MSQIIGYENIQQVQDVTLPANLEVTQASDVLIAFMNSFHSHQATIKKSTMELESGSTPVLVSPSAARASFRKHLAASKVKGSKMMAKAVMEGISQSGYLVTDARALTRQAKAVLKASPEQVNQAAEKLLAEIEQQHTAVFVNSIAQVVKNAANTTNFKDIKISVSDAVPHITAMNDIGQAIVSEVHVDAKTKKVNLISETVGITDGTCQDVMQQFITSLAQQGISASGNNKKWTGGNCILPASKKVNLRDSASSSQELTRRRKLNASNKINH